MDVADPSISGNTAKLLFAAVLVLGTVVAYLFRLVASRAAKAEKQLEAVTAQAAEKDRELALAHKQHDLELEKLRGEYEEKHREIAETYARDVKSLYEDNRIHEDGARKEFADILENVSAKAGESSQAIVNMLDKFYDRFVGPRPRY